MRADASGPADPAPAGNPPQHWVYDRLGALVYDGEPGLPNGPLRAALAETARSSLVGVLFGVLIVVVADTLGFPDAGMLAVVAVAGVGPVRQRHRLRARFAFAIPGVVCAALGLWLLGPRLPEPWEFFVPVALAIVVGEHVSTAFVYRRRRGDGAGRS